MHADLTSQIEYLRGKLQQAKPELLLLYPTPTYADLLASSPDLAPYTHVSGPVRAMSDSITALVGPSFAGTYHKLLMLEIIAKNRRAIDESGHPASIKDWYRRNFIRICSDVIDKRQPDDFYNYHNDKYLKDIGVCTLRIIPAGAQKLNRARLPFAHLLRGQGKWREAPTILRVLSRLRGLSPIYDMHTDSHDPELLAEFTPEGWKQFYRNSADLLETQPDVRGLFGVGWFFDRHVAQISPRLGYLCDLVDVTGGSLIAVGPTPGARASALATSSTRKKLFEEGSYIPIDVMAVWDRASLLKWARSQH